MRRHIIYMVENWQHYVKTLSMSTIVRVNDFISFVVKTPKLGFSLKLCIVNYKQGARGSGVGWDTMLQAVRSPVRVPDEVDFFNLSNPSSRTMTLRMSTRKFHGVKGGRRVELTTLSPSVSRMSENVGASTSCSLKGLHGLYRDNLNYKRSRFRYISQLSPQYLIIKTRGRERKRSTGLLVLNTKSEWLSPLPL
jgi:hypothetical protein